MFFVRIVPLIEFKKRKKGIDRIVLQLSLILFKTQKGAFEKYSPCFALKKYYPC